MINWLDTPLVTLGAVSVPRSWPIVALVSLYLAWIAVKKRHSALLWFVIAVGGFIAASEIVRYLIPNAVETLQRGQAPSAAHTIWSSAAFRSDFGLGLVVIVLFIVLAAAIRRLMDYASGPQRWQAQLSAAGSALLLAIPLVLWVWVAAWFVVKGDYTSFLLPLAAFVGIALVTAVAWYALEDWKRSAALIVIAVGVVLAQLRYNATRPPGSMFESNGSVPFFLALMPVILGVLVAEIVQRARSSRRYITMGWELGLMAWTVALVGWAVKFMGFYNYQKSYAFSLGSLFETPIRALVALDALYYHAVPREIADARNISNMNDWKTTLVVLAGIAVWLGVFVQLRWRVPALSTSFTLDQYLDRLRHPQLALYQRRYVLAYVLIAPAVVLRTFTTFYPFLQTLALSVQKYNPAFPPREYIAFRNFERLSTDLVVRESLTFTLVFVFVSTFFQMFLGLAIAHLLNAEFRLRGLARTISLRGCLREN